MRHTKVLGTGQALPGRIKVRIWRSGWGLCLLAAILADGAVVLAQPRDMEPGSILIFPFYDARPESVCILTVTNICASRVRGDGLYRVGDVQVHYHYSDGRQWLTFDRSEILTPGDTLSVIVSQHTPELDRGFVWVQAEDPETELPIDFDYLIGDMLVARSDSGTIWDVPGIAFRSLAEEPLPPGCPPHAVAWSRSGHAFADLNGDGLANFDGCEYDEFPETLYVSRFFQESDVSRTRLFLITTMDPSAMNTVDFTFWNNREQQFSRSMRFQCWWEGSLSDIGMIARNLQGDPTELGPRVPQTGWLEIAGVGAVDLAGNPLRPRPADGPTKPPILGCIVEELGGTKGQAAGRLLHHRGVQDGGSL